MCSFTVVRAHTAPGAVPGRLRASGSGADQKAGCRQRFLQTVPPLYTAVFRQESAVQPENAPERPLAPSAPLAREYSGIPFRSLQPGQSVPHRLRSLTRTGCAA